MPRYIQNLDWVWAMLRLNWANVTAHKGAFWSMAMLMCIQNLIYFMSWVFVFERISDIHGWGLREVAYLYGAGTIGCGIMFSVFGGLNQAAYMIEDGELDTYLARPRSALWMIMLSRMRAESLGDTICGLVVLAFFAQPALSDVFLLIILSLSAGVVCCAFRLFCHTLTFWGISGSTGENGFMAFIITATNPQNGFSGWAKLALLTVFPAGYVSLLPVEILRDFRLDYLAWQLGGSMAVFAFSLWLFERGLRRYTSGSRFLVLR